MNPLTHNTGSNELIPLMRFMGKLAKHLNFDDTMLERLEAQLDDITKCSCNFNSGLSAVIGNLIENTCRELDAPKQHPSVMSIISMYNPNIRMPENASKILIEHIHSVFVDIGKSVTDDIICTDKIYRIINIRVEKWLSANKDHYVIL